jgi:hypothetical protein
MITRAENKNQVADAEEKLSNDGINYDDIQIYLVEPN